ncbi:hypothetical protein J4226_01185 [Candidatus Pacearchaeota archaeon]|nr:hypothetical protein [Candidatus Pacearchaeota archaeon]
MKFQGILKGIKKFFTEDPEEKEENENFDKFLERISKRIDKTNKIAGGGMNMKERAQIALMIESARLQKETSETNKNLHNTNVLLLIASSILAYTAVKSSPNSNEIISGLTEIMEVALTVALLLFTLGIIFKILSWIFGLIKKWLIKNKE